MRPSWRAMGPIAMTLPRHFGSHSPARRRWPSQWTFGALIALGATLLAAGAWLPAKAALAQRLLHRAWAETAATGGAAAIPPWPWADTWPVARLSLPGHREPLTVLAGTSGRTLAFAPGLMDGSAAPGAPGTSVIAGHRDTHFRALREIALGDELVLERPDGASFTYEVVALDVVDSERTELRLDAEESVLALVTCWPFDALTVGGSWRYVVTARRRF